MGIWAIDAIVFGAMALAVLIGTWYERRRLTRGPYTPAGPLLTPAEAHFFHALRRALAGRAAIMCKVRLWDVAQAVSPRLGQAGLLMRQHLDFVIVDKTSFRPLCVVELDDGSHRLRKSQWRDRVKDRALEGARIPCLRVRQSNHYDTVEIARRLATLEAGGTGF
jgi:very-short-patch-repair endonuclease